MFFAGKYGATVKPFNKEVQKKCIGDAEADHLPSGRSDSAAAGYSWKEEIGSV